MLASPLLLLLPLSALSCVRITKPKPGSQEVKPILPIFGKPQAPATTTSGPAVVPSCRCGEGAGAGAAAHPWLVGLRLAAGGAWRCTGSLITPSTVITAASCVLGLTPALLAVVVGEHSLLAADGEVEVAVASILPHPNYSVLTSDSDLALVTLQQEVELVVNKVGLLCLPKHNARVEMRTVFMIGWGLNSSTGAAPDLPQRARLETLTNSVCAGPTTVYTAEDITDNMLCARDEEGSSCVGESGSPLVQPEGGGRYYSQAGLLSWGLGCGREEAPTVFTRLPAFLPWIEEHLGGQACSIRG